MARRTREELINDYAADVEALLSDCEAGQSYDEGEAMWRNPHSSLRDVIERAGVPDRYWEDTAKRVTCPCCSEHHSLWDEVGYKFDQELRAEHLRAEWYSEHDEQLESFAQHIAQFPFAGLAHPMGKEILDSLERFPASAIEEATWFRARQLQNGGDPAPEAFRNPDPTTTQIGEGRYNHYGQSVLYLAETEPAAVEEVVSTGERRAWVGRLRVTGLQRILDLGFDDTWADEDLPLLAFGLAYSGRLTTPVERAAYWKPEYFVSRFIADCARLRGHQGIIVRSSRSWAKNLILFSWSDDHVCVVPPPVLFELPATEREHSPNLPSLIHLL